jgi:hypothetical protein
LITAATISIVSASHCIRRIIADGLKTSIEPYPHMVGMSASGLTFGIQPPADGCVNSVGITTCVRKDFITCLTDGPTS